MSLRTVARWSAVPLVVGVAGLVLATQAPTPSFTTVAAKGAAAGVVSETPVQGGAQVLDGTVSASTQIGDVIYLGGTFTKIKTSKGATVTQPYLAAVSAKTGDLVTGFKPKVDQEVKGLIAGPAKGELIAAGSFTQVNGAAQLGIAKLNAATGASIKWPVKISGYYVYPKQFKLGAMKKSTYVRGLALLGDRLFIGGNFTDVNGVKRAHLAEVSASTGKVSSAFTAGVGGAVNEGYDWWDGQYWYEVGMVVVKLHLLPGNRLVVVHRGTEVGGQRRPILAMLDVSGAAPKVTPWATDFWNPDKVTLDEAKHMKQEFTPAKGAALLSTTMDSATSPDGKMVVLATHGSNDPPYHNMALAFPTTTAAHTKPLWVTMNMHATLAVGVSSTAVYVGGHFCYTEGPLSKPDPMFVPGRMEETDCATISPDVATGKNLKMFVKRDKIAALDLKTGRALDWNPGSNGRHGITMLTMVGDDLLIGHDGTTVGGVQTGGLAIMRG